MGKGFNRQWLGLTMGSQVVLCDWLDSSLTAIATATADPRGRVCDALLAEAVAAVNARDYQIETSPDAEPFPTFFGGTSEAAG